MKLFIGFFIVMGSVIGGFVLSHGQILALWQPYEALIIMGAGFGSFVISNPPSIIFGAFRSLPGLVKGSRFNDQLYVDILSLLYAIFQKSRREGMIAIEEEIDDPDNSPLFNRYPHILNDYITTDFIVDYLRLMVAGSLNSFEMESLMDAEIESVTIELEQTPGAIAKVADALPGFGIVAAVLGIVITMGFLDGPPAELGQHVASALVGTFIGILLAYGFVGPFAIALEHEANNHIRLLYTLKITFIAVLNGYNPSIAIEFGRKTIAPEHRPGFTQLEEAVKAAAKANN